MTLILMRPHTKYAILMDGHSGIRVVDVPTTTSKWSPAGQRFTPANGVMA